MKLAMEFSFYFLLKYFGYEIICYYTRIGNSAFTVSNEPNSFLMSLYPSYLLIGWDVVSEMTEIGLLVRESQDHSLKSTVLQCLVSNNITVLFACKLN